MADDDPPPGLILDSDGPAGTAEMPAGLVVDGPDTGPPPETSEMPTHAQMTDPNLSPEQQGALARQTGRALAAGAQKDRGDIGEWVGHGLRTIVGTPINAAAHLLGAESPIDVTPSAGAQRVSAAIDKVMPQNPLAKVSADAQAYDSAHPQKTIAERVGLPGASTMARKAGDIETIGATTLGSATTGDVGVIPEAEGTAPAPMAAGDTLSAARARPSLDGTTPEFQQSVAAAKNPNYDAIDRQANAMTLPMPEGQRPEPLRKGQMTRDDQQISDEKNIRSDTESGAGDLMRDSITKQNDTLGLSMGETRRQATPDIVGRSTLEHDQAAIDAIKTQDNAAITDIRQKYKAVEDANGGAFPIDTKAVLDNTTAALHEGLLFEHAPTAEMTHLQGFANKGSMTFEQFEALRTNLARVMRSSSDGNEVAAARIMRSQLEQLPITPGAGAPFQAAGAGRLKVLADQARAAAKARFDTIAQNPAYAAVVDDDVPMVKGLHDVGKQSPLAGKFMDQYFLGNGPNATRAYIARMKGVMHGNPDFGQAVEASALNKLRASAGLNDFDEGNFAHSNFRKTLSGMSPKADVLMQPQTAANIDKLRRYSDDVSYEGKAASVNRSNTALTLMRFGALPETDPTVWGDLVDTATDLGAAHLGPVPYAGTKILKAVLGRSTRAKQVNALKAAKLKFAQDAIAPGAGIESPMPAAGARASGGKVDHEVLVSRLMNRWHSARKHANKATEPLLNVPDEAITRALQIAHQSSQAHA